MEDKLTSQASMARGLIRGADTGVMSTMSTELPGYPFGSVTPYVMTHDGKIAVYVSGIAQHTANMNADPKTCLTVMEQGDGNRQNLGRVTIVGDAVPVPEDRVAGVSDRYYRFFPEAREYGQTHDFFFYWIDPVRVRYIGGFGKILWIEKETWRLADPEWMAEEEYIVNHMNEGHSDSLVDIARHFCGITATKVELVAVDMEGCHLRADGEVRYVQFDLPCPTMGEVRAAMVQMARSAVA